MAWGRGDGLGALLDRPLPSRWDRFCAAPIAFLASIIYSWSSLLHTRASVPEVKRITVVCISDTHTSKPELPDGDILLHAGDVTQSGSRAEIQETVDWLNTQPHRHKVVVAGNHDLFLDSSYAVDDRPSHPGPPQQHINWGNVIYLQNAMATLQCVGRKVSVFGSPWSPRHGNWAFQYPRKEDVWADVLPPDIDILVTHTPPKSHLDLGFGCRSLLRELWRLPKKPCLHVFGHLHGGHGQQTALFDGCQRQYERLIDENQGFGGLVTLMYGYLQGVFFFLCGKSNSGHGMLMVNASIVGGVRDELRREPTVVYI